MNFLDRFAFKVHYLIHVLGSSVKKNTKINLSDYAQILDKNTLLCDAGYIATTIEITGVIGSTSDKGYLQMVAQLSDIIDDYLTTGTQFNVRYAINSKTPVLLSKNIERLHSANKNMGLGLGTCIDSLEGKIKDFLNNERISITIYSSLLVVEEHTLKKHNESLKTVQFPPTGKEAYNDFSKTISAVQRQNHAATVEAVLNKINDFSYAKVLSAVDTLRLLREFTTLKAQEHWSPITGNDAPETFFMNDIENKNPSNDDASLFMPAPLQTQIVPRIERISDDVYKIDDLFFSALEVQTFPVKRVVFEELRKLIVNKKISAYINFTLLPEGFKEINGPLKTKIANFTGSVTFDGEAKYLAQVLKNAGEEKKSIAIQCDISFFAKDIECLERDRSILNKHITGWGGASADVPGDALRIILTSVGLKRESIAPKACTVPSEIAYLLPLLTIKKPFEQGNILLRTPSGHIYPYSTEMNRQSGATLIYGPMGYSKSVFLGQIVKSVVNDAALKNNKLPKIAFIDIAKSTSGIIPYLKNVVNRDMREEISYIKLTMSTSNNINPMDTILGVRVPVAEHINSIKGIFTLFTIDNIDDKIQDGVLGLLEYAIKTSYQTKAGKSANLYQKGILLRVDSILESADITIDDFTTWWEVVDMLFDKSFIEEAEMAQRYAMPLISDIIAVVRTPEAASTYSFKTKTDETLVDFTIRKLTEASEAYPILTKPSTMSSKARISYINLNDVSPSNNKKQTAIMYLLSRMVLVKDWMLSWDSLEPILEKRYKKFYKNKIEADIGVPKVIIYDEFHRTGAVRVILDQVEMDIREGPKYAWFVVLSTQKLLDISDTISSLSTSAIILGGSGKKEQLHSKDIFGLNDEQVDLMRTLSKPNKNGAELLFWLNDGDKRYVQKLISTLSTEELWILNSDATPSSIRDQLYGIFGVEKTITFLSKKYPAVSFDKELEAIRQELQNDIEKKAYEASELIPILFKQIKVEFEKKPK